MGRLLRRRRGEASAAGGEQVTRPPIKRGVTYKTTGTGLFRRHVRSVTLNVADTETVMESFRALNESEVWLWHGQLRDWRAWLDDRLPDTRRCPGRNDDRCCGWWRLAEADEDELDRRAAIQEAAFRATGSEPSEGGGRRTIEWFRDRGCGGGSWRELDDLEWYIADAEWLFRIVEKRVAEADANAAAVYAIKLGNRLAQIEVKLKAEDDAMFGRAKREASASGGRATRKRPDTERIAAVSAKLAANPQLGDAGAIRRVARDLGDSVHTISKAWKAWKRRQRTPQ